MRHTFHSSIQKLFIEQYLAGAIVSSQDTAVNMTISLKNIRIPLKTFSEKRIRTLIVLSTYVIYLGPTLN